MASVASANGTTAAAATMAPGNLTKEKLNSLLQRAKFLQMQGATENNNTELAQIMQFLKSLQRPKMTGPSAASSDAVPSQNAESNLTPNQLAALRYQILAYKLISKNIPLPPHLQQAVLNTTPESPKVPPTPASPAQTPPSPKDQQHFNAYASPYQLLKKPISSYAHASKQQRLLIPSITPTGMDPHTAITERERRVRARIQYRIHELEKIPSNLLMNLPNTLSVAHKTEANPKIKAIIELKALRLLGRQKRLRQEITGGMARSTTLATSADRLSYRRMKKQSLREARMTEKVERQQRLDRDRREKQKQLDYLQSICDHGRNLVAAQRAYQAKQSKLGRAVLQFHQHVEKEEQKKAERLSKERIRALKADDEEAYMKLIDEAKDTRLTQLLRQTGVFLESLTRSVVDQQNDAVHGFELPTVDEDENEGKAAADYFQVTHRIKEDVSQPTILVGGTLKEYQLKGLQWMVSLYNNHLNGILADEMGLGKTIQTISLITYLIEKKRQNGPYLIIVPLSTLTNWSLEFDKWAPSVKTIVYKGPPLTRRMLQMDIRQGDFQVLLTTFEYIIKDRPLLSKIRWLHMIIDEGHRMKNTNSKLVQVLRQYYHTRYRLILTGTPLQNNLPELWALLNFILPKIFKSVKSFEEWFNTPFNTQGVSDKIGLNEEEQLLIIKRLHKVLRPFLLRRLKKDVESELPDKVERVIKCKLSSLQLKLYSQMKKSGILYTASGEKGRTGIKGLNNTIMQLRKICNHPFVFEEVENEINPLRQSNDLLYRTSGKFELLDRMLPKLKETGHRVLIFFQMTQIMSIMEDFLNYRGFNYLRLDGSTKADDRSELLHLFNAPDSPYFVFLLSTRAGGLGLNLQAADTVIIFDSDWNPHQDLQAQDRAHRIGQTKEVRIFRLISANSIEENILARANYKLDIDGKVIQAGKFDNRSTDEDREAFLRSLLEDKADEQEEEEDDDIDDEELNEMLQRSDQEIAIFNKLDSDRRRDESRRGTRNKKYERLIQEDELPEIYRYDELPLDEDGPELEYGRGQRSKESVRYDDGLTEEQWLNALEDDDVDLDDVIAKKEQRRRRRMEKLQDVDSSKEDANAKKRGRPKKDEIPRKKQRSAEAESDTLAPHVRKQLTHFFEQCYKAVEESVEEDEDGTVRDRCDLFMDLVAKKDYPLYYKLIKRPISMNMINKRIHSPHYRTIEQFRDDFQLMFDNARTFNEEGSIVYEDANELEKTFYAKYQELCNQDMQGEADVPEINGNR
ncbi:SNF2 family N-terminal domain-containing protein [Fennellomyces sp. T-0311]|nr:SNF2 family N-terminal domain-containing protein [Fennellomyces sp. T-0311]